MIIYKTFIVITLTDFWLTVLITKKCFVLSVMQWLGEGMLFCVGCGLLRRVAVFEPIGSLETLIRNYFQKCLNYNIMLAVLEANNNAIISMTSLKQKLNVMRLPKVCNMEWWNLIPNYSNRNSRPCSWARLSLYVG